MVETHTIDNGTILREVGKLLSEGKRVKLRAKGESMRPFILNGDSMIMAGATDYVKGDVVLARLDEGRYVVHRIIKLEGEHATLMGDGNLYFKEFCAREAILGKVVGVVRDGKERSMLSKASRIKAFCWRSLLPLRRLVFKVNLLKNRLGNK